jgi:hypothetical protein
VARGVKMGRKPKLTAHQQREAIKRRVEVRRLETRIGWIIHVKPHNAALARLSSAQRAALSHVEATVRGQEEAARSRVVGILSRAACQTDTYDTKSLAANRPDDCAGYRCHFEFRFCPVNGSVATVFDGQL